MKSGGMKKRENDKEKTMNRWILDIRRDQKQMEGLGANNIVGGGGGS